MKKTKCLELTLEPGQQLVLRFRDRTGEVQEAGVDIRALSDGLSVTVHSPARCQHSCEPIKVSYAKDEEVLNKQAGAAPSLVDLLKTIFPGAKVITDADIEAELAQIFKQSVGKPN